MKVEVTISGKPGCGKTLLGDFLAKNLQMFTPTEETEVVIWERQLGFRGMAASHALTIPAQGQGAPATNGDCETWAFKPVAGDLFAGGPVSAPSKVEETSADSAEMLGAIYRPQPADDDIAPFAGTSNTGKIADVLYKELGTKALISTGITYTEARRIARRIEKVLPRPVPASGVTADEAAEAPPSTDDLIQSLTHAWDLLQTAAETFDSYAEHHEAKGTAEAAEKAARNRRMARLCRSPLCENAPEPEAA